MKKYRYLPCLIMALVFAGQGLHASEPTIEQAKTFLKEATETKRLESASMSFDAFKASVYKETFEGGKFIVNGDTPIVNEKQLREFYDKNIKNRPAPRSLEVTELTLAVMGGLDAVWSDAEKRRLLYCVSDQFASRHIETVAAMKVATAAWEAVANVDFIYLATEDGHCTAQNREVVFDVRPVDVGGRYLARAFFPNDSRSSRNVLIDESAFGLNPNGKLTLTGILRHELGHSLGFRHEHTRPEAGKCFEDENWRPLSDYDPFSVMHYPQCNGLGDWSLTLTPIDMSAAACLYGPASGFTVDPTICSGVAARTKTETFDNQVVEKGEKRNYAPTGPFMVLPGTPFTATMSGFGDTPGDPDLYLKFDGHPNVGEYDCRPYLNGADETCSVEVPQGKQQASVMVRGYQRGSYTLSVTYTSPD